jgi:hypothetical protein
LSMWTPLQAGPSSISFISLTSSRDLMPEVHTPVTALPHALPLHATSGIGWQCGVLFWGWHTGRMVAVKQTAGSLDRARNSDLRRRKLADPVKRRGCVRHILDCWPMPCVGDVRWRQAHLHRRWRSVVHSSRTVARRGARHWLRARCRVGVDRIAVPQCRRCSGSLA